MLPPHNYLHTAGSGKPASVRQPSTPSSPRSLPPTSRMEYVLFHEDFAGKPETAVSYYIRDGVGSAKALANLVDEYLGFQRDKAFKLLEFGRAPLASSYPR